MDKLYQLVQDFLAWLFGTKPAEKKAWCAAFYFVARQQNIGPPDVVLDSKLDEILGFLTISAVFDPEAMYVAYRAVWDDPLRQPSFGVVPSTLSSSPMPQSACLGHFTDAGTDLPCFLTWLYKACPAEH